MGIRPTPIAPHLPASPATAAETPVAAPTVAEPTVAAAPSQTPADAAPSAPLGAHLARFGDIRVTVAPPERRLVTTQDLKNDLGDLISTIENHYGPLKMKRESIGLDWDAHKARALAAVDEITNTREFYFLVADFLAALNDAHVNVTLPSSLRLTLPLQMSVAEGKIVVNFVSDDYPADVPKPALGDELIAINGEAPAAYQSAVPHFNGDGNDKTNRALFARQITTLSEAAGMRLVDFPRDITLTFRRTDGTTFEAPLRYAEQGTALIGRPVDRNPSFFPPAPQLASTLRMAVGGGQSQPVSSPEPSAPSGDGVSADLVDRLFPPDADLTAEERAALGKVGALMERFSALFSGDVNLAAAAAAPATRQAGSGTPMWIGRRKPFYALPSNFQEIQPPPNLEWLLNPKSFFAGTFERDGKRIGLLRIPSYSARNVMTLPVAINYYIGLLNERTDELIIDQMDNPGGMVVFSDLLLRALVGEWDEAKHMRFALKPSQGFLRTLIDIKDELEDDSPDNPIPPEERPAMLAEIQRSIDVVTEARNQGLPLTEPISLLPETRYFAAALKAALEPLRARNGQALEGALGLDIFKDQVYDPNKRVSFVINELDFSGGDATPAGFQDYGRGKLVGVRTAGAGGTVERFQQREVAEFQYSLTTSLMVRADGSYVENYGVTEDVPFEVTVEDYRNGHTQFFERLLQVLGYDAPAS